MNIAIETASALVYLHASEIIHRDVKTTNILLDHNFCVKVADFVSDTNPETMNMITLVAELAFRCLQYDSEMRPTMNEVLDVLMDIQDMGRIDTYDSTRDLQTVNASPLSETNDTAVLLKDFRPSPISVINEWQSNTSASTTLSSNGDRLSLKDNIDTYKTHGSKNDKSASIF
ncbi:hypothetical protein M8C21_029988 [Ambrosia artemisiifolia]|uniref:Protein kinase domain-containing protein n=1 Tax=Ambrosia artemisiifolia TaxID=4212 RepID=A0AAD5G4C3_AMBAR|nr:hypothetical protein M8C21_029988 [Ambrosia artemisiifolia]